MRAIAKRNSIINKYQIVYEVVSSAYAAPDGKDTLLSIPLPAQASRAKAFSDVADRFLLTWAATFGFHHFDECTGFLRSFRPLRNDYFLRSRDAGELRDRLDKLIKMYDKLHRSERGRQPEATDAEPTAAHE